MAKQKEETETIEPGKITVITEQEYLRLAVAQLDEKTEQLKIKLDEIIKLAKQ